MTVAQSVPPSVLCQKNNQNAGQSHLFVRNLAGFSGLFRELHWHASCPSSGIMKDNSFAMAMEKIVGQAEAEKQQEIRDQRRAEVFGRARSIFVFLLVATIGVFVFCYREQIQDKIFSKPSLLGTGKVAAQLNAARKNAAQRDVVIDSISK